MGKDAAVIIDCRTWAKLPDHGESQRSRVFLNGREIEGVWYLDTDAGIVKTFSILQDATTEQLARFRQVYFEQLDDTAMRGIKVSGQRFDRSALPAEWEIDAPNDGAVSRTLRGCVEVQPINAGVPASDGPQ
jgi:hypothetical protein